MAPDLPGSGRTPPHMQDHLLYEGWNAVMRRVKVENFHHTGVALIPCRRDGEEPKNHTSHINT